MTGGTEPRGVALPIEGCEVFCSRGRIRSSWAEVRGRLVYLTCRRQSPRPGFAAERCREGTGRARDERGVRAGCSTPRNRRPAHRLDAQLDGYAKRRLRSEERRVGKE